MTGWKTRLGVALGSLGHTLMGAGAVTQFAGVHSAWLTGIMIAGFVISALGVFFGQLFPPAATPTGGPA